MVFAAAVQIAAAPSPCPLRCAQKRLPTRGMNILKHSLCDQSGRASKVRR
jgi:hypothetical protein